MRNVAVRFLIEGRVQGVSFRACTQRQAQALELLGHANNLPDGRVEVLAIGAVDAVEQLATWLQHGPPLAEVQRVLREVADSNERHATDGFRTG